MLIGLRERTCDACGDRFEANDKLVVFLKARYADDYMVELPEMENIWAYHTGCAPLNIDVAVETIFRRENEQAQK